MYSYMAIENRSESGVNYWIHIIQSEHKQLTSANFERDNISRGNGNVSSSS